MLIPCMGKEDCCIVTNDKTGLSKRRIRIVNVLPILSKREGSDQSRQPFTRMRDFVQWNAVL